MDAERFDFIKQELSIICRGGQDPTGRYPELMGEVRRHATAEQQREIRAAVISTTTEHPTMSEAPREAPGLPRISISSLADLAREARECRCETCEAARYRERVREVALMLMNKGFGWEQALEGALAFETRLVGLPEGEA